MSFHFHKHHFNKKEKTSIDRAMMVVAVIHPLTALPQALQIFVNQSAENVSLITWLSFMAIGFIFTLYALVHRLKPMLLNQIIWFIVDSLVVFGILLYQ